mgnify:CR=1 FL=1
MLDMAFPLSSPYVKQHLTVESLLSGFQDALAYIPVQRGLEIINNDLNTVREAKNVLCFGGYTSPNVLDEIIDGLETSLAQYERNRDTREAIKIIMDGLHILQRINQ